MKSRLVPKDVLARVDGGMIDLAGYRLGAEGIRALFVDRSSGKALAGCESLDLRGNRIGAEGLKALSRAPVAAGLSSLDLSDCSLTDDSLRALERFESLESLRLEGNGLSAKGMQVLGRVKRTAQLDDLDISHNPIGSEGLASVRRAIQVDYFRASCIGADSSLGGELAGLCPGGSLDLSGSKIGDDGARALARWGARPFSLALQFTGITNAGLSALAAVGMLDVDVLDLRGNPVERSRIGHQFHEDAIVKFDVSYADAVLVCPFCESARAAESHLCSSCRADVTAEEVIVEREDYVRPADTECPYCNASIPATASRCHACRSWLPYRWREHAELSASSGR